MDKGTFAQASTASANEHRGYVNFLSQSQHRMLKSNFHFEATESGQSISAASLRRPRSQCMSPGKKDRHILCPGYSGTKFSQILKYVQTKILPKGLITLMLMDSDKWD